MDGIVTQSSPEEVRRRRLKRMRLAALILLLLMLASFVACRYFEPLHPWLAYPRAFAEAAMVGGIADWFAVTALFRHPFGLPIPHTAIIPRNKDRIGDSLGNFVASNFLEPHVVTDKLISVNVARRLAEWLAHEDNARRVAGRVAGGIPGLLNAFRDEHAKEFLRANVLRRLRRNKAAPLAGSILSTLVAQRRHEEVFDRLIDGAHGFLIRHQETIRRKVREKSGRWIPKWVDEKLSDKIILSLEETLLEMQFPKHPWRDEFHRAAEDLVRRLSHDPDYIQRGEALKEEVLGHPTVQRYLDSLWGDIKERLLKDISPEGKGRIEKGLTQGIAQLGERLKQDEEMQTIVNGWVERIVLNHVVPRRSEIGHFIAGVVRKWDARTMVDKLELHVGRDLQYIRINGTLVGGLVGLLIHLLNQVTSR